MNNGTPAIEVASLYKTYGDVVAVDGVSFTVAPGQTFCLVGPNGAGKTTTVESIIGLRRHDGGTVRVLGLSPQRQRARMFARVGVQFQDNSLYPRIKTWEALRLYARMYDDPLDEDELLDAFDLQHRRDVFYKDLSGGERRKLLTAIALVGDPDLIFLDEPTSGLDPHSRRALWSTLHRYRSRGLTIFLTTHNMQEAEEESEVVCILDGGRIVAQGRPEALLRERRLGTRVAAHVNGSDVDASAFDDCPGLTRVGRADHTLRLYGEGEAFAAAATETLQARGVHEFSVRPAGLEDLYLMTTGNPYEAA